MIFRPWEINTNQKKSCFFIKKIYSTKVLKTEHALLSLPMLSRPWFVEPVGCPWAWLWLVWHEWRTSLCPQTDQQGKLHWPLVRPQWLHSGILGRFWNPGQSHGPGAGRGVSWWEVLCSSGISWFHGGQQFRACICEAS